MSVWLLARFLNRLKWFIGCFFLFPTISGTASRTASVCVLQQNSALSFTWYEDFFVNLSLILTELRISCFLRIQNSFSFCLSVCLSCIRIKGLGLNSMSSSGVPDKPTRSKTERRRSLDRQTDVAHHQRHLQVQAWLRLRRIISVCKISRFCYFVQLFFPSLVNNHKLWNPFHSFVSFSTQAQLLLSLRIRITPSLAQASTSEEPVG